MRSHRLPSLAGLTLSAACVLASCRSITPAPEGLPDRLDALARTAPFVTGTERPRPAPVPDDVAAVLTRKKATGQTDHFGLLVEYGLRVHWHDLQHTRLARELPLETDLMLSELVRIAGIPRYTTAHEAGWLNRQFEGPFQRTGWSSYQVYVWVKENASCTQPDNGRFPNWKRISELIDTIDRSGLNGIGGGDVCHYECQ